MSFPMPKLVASSIPTITALREQLDYGDSHLSRCNAFYDDVRTFRKRYRTHDGSSGISLYNWKSPEHQAGLKEMTEAYLDKEGNGALYWPDGDTDPNRNKLRYSQDHHLIKQIMMQLFFRLNQQQYRNTKYKKKGQSSSDDRYHHGRSPASPIDIDEDEVGSERPVETTISPFLTSHESSSARSAQAKPTFANQPPHDPASLPVNSPQSGNENASRLFNPEVDTARLNDIYEVPGSPVESGPTNETSRVVNRSLNTKHGLDAEDAATLGRVGKRAKAHHKTLSKNDGESNNVKIPLPRAKWTSPRERKTVHRPGCATKDEVDEAISSPTLSVNPKAEMYARRRDGSENTRPALIMGGDDSQATRVVKSVEQDFSKNPPSPGPVNPEIPMKEVQPSNIDEAVQSSDASTFHYGHMRAPSSVSEAPKEIRHQSEQNDAPKQGARSKVNIEFVYRVILSRTPVYLCKGWHPKGKFQEKSLRELLTELPLEGTVKGLAFTLEGPGLHIEEQIDGEDENRFEIMKKHFNKQIRACLASCAQSKTPLLIEIEIEPLRGESVQGNDEIDDADIDW